TKGDIAVATGASTPVRRGVGANDTVLTADSAQADGVKWAAAGGGADFPEKVKPAVTRWVIPGWFFNGSLNDVANAGVIFYVPIFVEETTTYIRIGINVQTAVSGDADLRIFNWSGGLPGALVLAAGTVSHATTGNKEITISEELTRGYYFLAIRCSGSPTLKGIDRSDNGVVPPVAGLAGGLSFDNFFNMIPIKTAAYADPAPTPDSITSPSKVFVRLREN
ncbi:hypothetical protein LCGC14_2387220, partial [marine sediment metagenome]